MKTKISKHLDFIFNQNKMLLLFYFKSKRTALTFSEPLGKAIIRSLLILISKFTIKANYSRASTFSEKLLPENETLLRVEKDVIISSKIKIRFERDTLLY